MHDTKDGPAPAMQVEESLSEKKSRASKVRWTRQKALELGLSILEADGKVTSAITPASEPAPPPPTDPAVWQAKLREVFWSGLLDADEKILGYLAKLFNISFVEEIDLQLTPDEIELIRRHRAWKLLGPDEQHRALEETFDAAQLLPLWKAAWRWNPAIAAWQPRQETYRCPECGEVLYEYSAPESTVIGVTTHTGTPERELRTTNGTVEAVPPDRSLTEREGLQASKTDPLSQKDGIVHGASASSTTATRDFTEPATARPTHQPHAAPAVGPRLPQNTPPNTDHVRTDLT